MKIRFQTDLKVNVKSVLKNCMFTVPEHDVYTDIKNAVCLWAEQRLKEDGWPIPISTQEIREYLIENGSIVELNNTDENGN